MLKILAAELRLVLSRSRGMSQDPQAALRALLDCNFRVQRLGLSLTVPGGLSVHPTGSLDSGVLLG